MPRTKAEGKIDYTFLKIPKDLVDEVDKVLGKHGYRSRSEFVKDAIRRLLTDYGVYIPEEKTPQ